MAAPIYQNISQGIASAGIEYYLPLFFQETANLLHYLPSNSIVIQVDDCMKAAEHFWDEVRERYDQCNIDHTRPLLAPERIYYPCPDFFAATYSLAIRFIPSLIGVTKQTSAV